MEKELSDKVHGGDNDFESLMEQSLRAPRPGDVLVGTVLLITRDSVIIDINYKCEGQVPLAEFLDHEGNVAVKEGDEVDVYFEGTETENGTVMLSHAKAEKFKVWRELERAFQNETPVEGVILGKVKGGLQVDIGVPAFLPGSHVDIRPARNLDRYVGQRGRFQILKFNRARGNVVVSRRSVIERERTSLKEQTLKVLEEGVILEGTVKNITDYGAFVDLGGLDGLLHITDMSWGRLQHPSEVVKVGDKVKVVVLKYDPARERVSLGMKQIMADPWTRSAESYPVGARFKGKVVSVTDYGAFVELEKGVEGLIHVSEMSWSKRAVHPSKVVNPATWSRSRCSASTRPTGASRSGSSRPSRIRGKSSRSSIRSAARSRARSNRSPTSACSSRSSRESTAWCISRICRGPRKCAIRPRSTRRATRSRRSCSASTSRTSA